MNKFAIISFSTYVTCVIASEALLLIANKESGIILNTIGYIAAAGCIISIFYFGWFIYMHPAKTAKKHNNPHASTLWWVNLIFGWMLIPWLICLLIATNGSKTSDSLEGALRELEDLKHKKLISEEEYAAKRARILS